MVTTVPLNSKASSSFGIAVISLDFLSPCAAPAPGRCLRPRPKPCARWPSCPAPRSRAGPCRRCPPPHPRSAWRSTIPKARSPFKLLRIERRKHTVEGMVRRYARGQGQKCLQPLQLGLAIVGDIVPALGAAQHRRYRNQENLFQQMFPVPLHTRITQLRKILQRIFHIPFSNIHTHSAYSNLYAPPLR